MPSASFLISHPRFLEFVFLAFVVLMVGLCIFIALKKRMPGSTPPLLLACALGALTIPSTSFDYTLAFLPAAMAIYFQHIADNSSRRTARPRSRLRHWLRVLGVAVMSFVYFATLFSYTNKPDVFFLVNNFPALFVLLLLTPLLAVL